jgi:aspartyl-tRNA(Asn)/glutamyl-tRNA(Gln) amidotransferase subunit C
MTRITRDEVQKIARLSRLEFDHQDADRTAGHLSDILDYIEKMNELDTGQVPPTSHAIPLTNVMREDETRPSLGNEQALANAPGQENGCFRVPPIIQEQ